MLDPNESVEIVSGFLKAAACLLVVAGIVVGGIVVALISLAVP